MTQKRVKMFSECPFKKKTYLLKQYMKSHKISADI